MVLHLAPKKSYHPARRDNIERVKRDEAEAQRQQELEEQQSLHADAQARLDLLRGHAVERAKEPSKVLKPTDRKRKRLDPGEAELERQLGSKGWTVSKAAEEEVESRAVIVKPETDVKLDTGGHINFWADIEQGAVLPPRGNAEYAADKKKEQDRWDEQITMYLGRPAKELKPWYGERDLRNGEDRKRTDDQLLEAAYKDEELKRMTDPLAMMASYLKQRQEAHAAADRARADPWAATPARLSTPVPSLLRKRTKRGEEPAYKRHIMRNIEQDGLQDDYGPAPPRPRDPSPDASAPKPSLQDAAKARETSERARAQALKAAAKRKRLMSETPQSEAGSAYHEQFNRRETRDAQRSWQHRRWEDEVGESRAGSRRR